MLGARIAALRRQAGLSQAQLAQHLKISPSAMGMYEQGRREPSMETVVALAREFRVSTDYLLTGSHPAPPDQRLEEVMLRRIRAADDNLEMRTQIPISTRELAAMLEAMLKEGTEP